MRDGLLGILAGHIRAFVIADQPALELHREGVALLGGDMSGKHDAPAERRDEPGVGLGRGFLVVAGAKKGGARGLEHAVISAIAGRGRIAVIQCKPRRRDALIGFRQPAVNQAAPRPA